MKSEDTSKTDKTVYSIPSDRLIRRVILCCFGIEVLCVLLDLLFAFTSWIPVIELRKIFDMTREGSVGTWLSVILSLLVGSALLLIFLTVRAGDRSRRQAIGWLVLSLFFIYMSLDDCAYIHERSGDFLDRMVSSDALPLGLSGVVARFPTYYWQLILGPLYAAMGLFMLYFVWQRFGEFRLRKYMVFSLMGLAAAVLIDFVEGTGRGIYRITRVTGMSERSAFHLIMLIEESLEILGLIILLYAFMKYLSLLVQGKTLSIER